MRTWLDMAPLPPGFFAQNIQNMMLRSGPLFGAGYRHLEIPPLGEGPFVKFYEEKLEPQPQDLVEWGLMKLKPWRMRVSS